MQTQTLSSRKWLDFSPDNFYSLHVEMSCVLFILNLPSSDPPPPPSMLGAVKFGLSVVSWILPMGFTACSRLHGASFLEPDAYERRWRTAAHLSCGWSSTSVSYKTALPWMVVKYVRRSNTYTNSFSDYLFKILPVSAITVSNNAPAYSDAQASCSY